LKKSCSATVLYLQIILRIRHSVKLLTLKEADHYVNFHSFFNLFFTHFVSNDNIASWNWVARSWSHWILHIVLLSVARFILTVNGTIMHTIDSYYTILLNIICQKKNKIYSCRFDSQWGHWIFNLLQPLTKMSTRKSLWGLKRGRCLRLTTTSPPVRQLSTKCGIFDISQPHRLPWPVTSIALLWLIFCHRVQTEIGLLKKIWQTNCIWIVGNTVPRNNFNNCSFYYFLLPLHVSVFILLFSGRIYNFSYWKLLH
jgi:hypothetical protein